MMGRIRETIRALIVLVLLVCFVGLGVPATAPKLAQAGTSDDLARINEDYQKALKLYQTGKYNEALSLLNLVEEKYRALTVGRNERVYANIVESLAELYHAQ